MKPRWTTRLWRPNWCTIVTRLRMISLMISTWHTTTASSIMESKACMEGWLKNLSRSMIFSSSKILPSLMSDRKRKIHQVKSIYIEHTFNEFYSSFAGLIISIFINRFELTWTFSLYFQRSVLFRISIIFIILQSFLNDY